MSRRVLTILFLLGLLVVLGVLFSIGRESPRVAHITSSPSAADLSRSPEALDAPESVVENPTREDVPIPVEPIEASDVRNAASVSGIVLDADTQAPIDRFEVIESPTGTGGVYVDTLFGYELAEAPPSLAFSGTGGRFVLSNLGPEARNVAVVAPGYEIAKVQVVEIAPGLVHEDLVFRMRPAATLQGRVIDLASGAPVDGALVAWIDDGGQARTGPNERFARTDALGRFVLDWVPAGPRRLLAGREDLGQAFTPTMELEPGVAAHEIVIELGGTGPK